MNRVHLKLIAPLVALFSPLVMAADLTLVADGQARAVIVTADRASAAAKKGAVLLAAQIELISGAKLPVITESSLAEVSVTDGLLHATMRGSAPEVFVLVGESDLTGKLGVTSDGLGAGGILLRTLPNALVLLGPDDKTPSDPNGSRYAVTTFLEEALGFRMLWPGELGLVAPPRPTVAIGTINKTFTPMIGQRQIRNQGYSDRIQAGLDYLGVTKTEYDRIEAIAAGRGTETPGWFEWQRLGGSIGLEGGHAFGYTWEKYHVEHPEWFALQHNGSRDLTKLAPERARLCKSNLELIEALARDKIAELDLQRGKKSISLSPNDGGLASFCVCEECLKLDPPEGRKTLLWDLTSNPRREYEYVSLTDRMVWFWNQLATRITAKHPDAWLTVYAYSAYHAPPVREKLHPNLAVAFTAMNYWREADRKTALADWEDWAVATKKLYWRPNLLLFARREGTPAIYAHKLGEDLQSFAHHSLLGTDFDSCTHHWATEGVNYYVLARLLWNPDESVDAILDDYCQSGFGDASREVRRYLTRIEELTDGIAANGLTPPAPYTPEIVAELGGILDAAEKLAGDDTIRRRVNFLRRGLEFSALQNQTHGIFARSESQQLDPAGKAELLKLQEQKWRFMRRQFQEEPFAVNMPMVAFGSEGAFARFGWEGAASVSSDAAEADEEGRPIDPARGLKK